MTLACIVTLALLLATTSSSYFSRFGERGTRIEHPTHGSVASSLKGHISVDTDGDDSPASTSGDPIRWYRFDTVPDGAPLLDTGDAYNTRICVATGDVTTSQHLTYHYYEGTDPDDHPTDVASFSLSPPHTCYTAPQTSNCTTSIYVGVSTGEKEEQPYRLSLSFEAVGANCVWAGAKSAVFYVAVSLASLCICVCAVVAAVSLTLMCRGDVERL